MGRKTDLRPRCANMSFEVTVSHLIQASPIGFAIPWAALHENPSMETVRRPVRAGRAGLDGCTNREYAACRANPAPATMAEQTRLRAVLARQTMRSACLRV